MDVWNGHLTNFITLCGYIELFSFPLRDVLINVMGSRAGHPCRTIQIVLLNKD